jgi:hypothetical protein
MSVHPIPNVNDDMSRAGKVRNRSNVRGIGEYVAVLIIGRSIDRVLNVTLVDLYVKLTIGIRAKDKVGKREPPVIGVMVDMVGRKIRHCVSFQVRATRWARVVAASRLERKP